MVQDLVRVPFGRRALNYAEIKKKGHPEEKSSEKHLDITSLPSLKGADSSLRFITLPSSWVNLAAYIPEQWHRNLGHPLISSV